MNARPGRSWQLAASIGCVGVMVLSACSGGATATAVDPTVQAQLRRDLHTLTQSVLNHDPLLARAAISALNADLAAAYSAGKVSDPRMASIRDAVARVQADLLASPVGSTPPSTAAVAATSAGIGKPSAPNSSPTARASAPRPSSAPAPVTKPSRVHGHKH